MNNYKLGRPLDAFIMLVPAIFIYFLFPVTKFVIIKEPQPKRIHPPKAFVSLYEVFSSLSSIRLSYFQKSKYSYIQISTTSVGHYFSC